MADSDEEQEGARNRDKFRRERSDYGGSNSDKPRSRSDYREKRTWREEHDSSRKRGRDDHDDRDRRRYPARIVREWSPPPHKRMRRDLPWGEPFRDYPGMMGPPYGMRPPWMHPDMPPPGHRMPPGHGGHPVEPMGMGTPPSSQKRPMLTFKQFLTQQEDNIDEEDAIRKYNEYKSDFKRKQIAEFFDNHKEEDWFIRKYHPKHVAAEKELAAANLQARVQAFLFLLESGRVGEVPLSYENTSDIARTMDAAVIKMEGGTDRDLLALDQTQTDQGDEREEEEEGEGEEKGRTKKMRSDDQTEDQPSFTVGEQTEEQRQLARQARDYGKVMQAMVGEGEGDDPEKAEGGTTVEAKAEPSDPYSFGEKDESNETSTADNEPPPPGMETTPPVEEPPPPGMEEPVSREAAGALPETGQTMEDAESKENGDDKSGEVGETDGGLPPPRPLHLTRSVYIRHIPPKISMDNIVQVCRTIPGYLRIAFADPSPEKGYERRGWVTYKSDTDIRDACARLTAHKIKDCQLNCMVNRDLIRRVKATPSGVVWGRRAIRGDLRLLLTLVRALDRSKELWEYSPVQPATGETGTEVDKALPNPILAIPESLLAEDEEPMTTGGEEEEGVVSDPGTEIRSDQDEIVKTVDGLIWYLRIVHSVDYYNATVFTAEDCMPHRCGIITARTGKPTALTQDEVTEYVSGMEKKVKPLMETKKELTEDDMEKFGKKDAEAEAERFMEVNTQKLSENKYLCPLSGKKFKGPEFVRKHIFNKHMEKVDDVKQEAEFFNNYLRDPDRPMPLEATVQVTPSLMTPGTPTTPTEEPPGGGRPGMRGSGGPWGSPPMVMFGGGRGFPPGFPPPGMMGRPRGRGRGRGRRVIQYHDLDAPEETY